VVQAAHSPPWFHSWWATLGLLAALLALRTPVSLASAWSQSAWWQWSGGLLGAIYIAGVVLAPRLGAGTLIAAVVPGQMCGLRLLGAALVTLGVALMQR
jgi:transporter family-2 protein